MVISDQRRLELLRHNANGYTLSLFLAELSNLSSISMRILASLHAVC